MKAECCREKQKQNLKIFKEKSLDFKNNMKKQKKNSST